MIYVAINILSIMTLTQLVRFGQLRGMRILIAIMINYMVAAVLSGAAFFGSGASGPIPVFKGALPFGVLNGALFFTHFLLLLASYQLAGLGITTALVGSGAIIPVVVSWLVWGEAMPWTRWMAVGLVPVTMFLLRPRRDGSRPMTLKGDAVLVLAVLMGGTILTVHKAAVVAQIGDQASLYRFALFSTAAVCSTLYVIFHRLRIGRRESGLGCVVGLVNGAGLWATVNGLNVLPAVVYYPIVNCMVIVLNIVLSGILWKERITRRQVAGIATAMVVVILANMGRAAS